MHQFVETAYYGAGYVRLLLAHHRDRAGRVAPRLKHGATEAVLLIPGFLGPSSVMRPLELRFELSGMAAFTFDLGFYSTLPFTKIKERLANLVATVCADNPSLQRLSIVAHSMGGLIAEQLIAEGAFNGLATKLVTLGSPFGGTWAALMGCPISLSAYEMLPIRRQYLDFFGSQNRITIPFLSIAGRNDILAPAERCVHRDAVRHTMPVDHAGLILQKKVFHVAREFLAQG